MSYVSTKHSFFYSLIVGCLSSVADTTVAITCPSNTAVHIDEKFHKTYGGSIYSTFHDFTFSENNYNNACKDSLICTIVTRTAYKKNASVNWICKGTYKKDMIN